MDTVDKATRSRIMSSIRAKGNRSTEGRLRMMLVRAGITGWKLHGTHLVGNPDFVFEGIRLALFVDGCFWHACPRCGHMPKSNRRYWRAKLDRNIRRDRRQRARLRREGWSVVRVWAHELQDGAKVVAKVSRAIAKREGDGPRLDGPSTQPKPRH